MTITNMRAVRAALDIDWTVLCREVAARPEAPAWVSGACGGGTDLEAWARAASASDEAVGAAVGAAQGGDAEAGRAVLHLLVPRLTRLAGRDAHHELGDYLAAAWLRLMEHPLERRPHALLVNLALDSLKALSRSYERAHRTPPPGSWPWADPSGPGDDPPSASALIAAASRAGWLPPPCVPVLRSVYCDGLSGREAARRHHTSPDMVRYRCSVGVRAMRRHADDLAFAA